MGRARFVVDGMVFLVLAVTTVVWFRSVDETWFFFDDFSLAVRGWSVGDFFEPYNGHLSVTYVAVYRVFYGLFGFSHHAVLQLIGLLAYVAVPVALYLTTRDVLGRGWAGVVAVAVAWTRGAALEPGAMNHWATLVGAVVVARALRGGSRRADAVLAVALLLAFGTSGGALPILVAAVLHNLLAGASRRRWAAVLVPAACWLVWRPFGNPDEGAGNIGAPSLTDQLRTVLEGNPISVVGLVGGNRFVAALLLVPLIAGLVWVVVLYGRAGAAAVLPWLGASGAWWVGLVHSRGRFADAHVHRYRYVAVVFLVLAAVDAIAFLRARDAAGDGRVAGLAVRLRSHRLPVWAIGVVLLAVVGSLASANRSANEEATRLNRAYGRIAEIDFRILTAVPDVSTSEEHSILLGALSQEQLLAASEAYGPRPLTRPALDRWLIGRGTLDLVDVVGETPPGGGRPCRATSWEEEVLPGESRRLRAGGGPAEVLARRFGDRWHEVGSVPAGGELSLVAEGSYSAPAVAWEVRVRGGCRP